jgi:serine protease AprX
MALSACALLILIAGSGTGGALLLPAPAAAAAIDARALALVDSNGSAPVVILMRAKPTAGDLSQRDDEPDSAHALVRALRDSADASQLEVLAEALARGLNARPYWIANAIAVDADRGLLDWLATRSDVERVEFDQPWHSDLPQPQEGVASVAAVEWNVQRVGAPALWTEGFTGQGITYAIADTGVDWQHPALKPHYRGWNGVAAAHAYNWWDAIHSSISGGANPCGFSSAAPCDDHGHGTHALGIGVGDDGAGNQVGVAPGARWIACRNMDSGVGRPSTYIECLEFLTAPWDANHLNPNAALRAHVISNSYGCPPSELCSSASLQSAVENVRAAGIAFVASAGNSGSGCGSVVDPPAIYAASFSVGATDSGDHMALFSSRGPVTVDGSNRLKPDLVAPGVGIRSSIVGNSYGFMSGTSMAAPHVAGAIALLWSAHPTLARDVPFTEAILRARAQQVTVTQACPVGTALLWPNNVAGSGLLDVAAAHALAHGLDVGPRVRLPFAVR